MEGFERQFDLAQALRRRHRACPLDDGRREDTPSIPEPRQGIQIQVLQKRNAAWRIVAFQNTNSLPEVPFPTKGSSTVRSPPSSGGSRSIRSLRSTHASPH
jgi:hypothetical protein